jgi:chromosome segregation ATPase
MNMPTFDTLESLQEALAPLGVLQNEQAELGTWIHDSFSALEKLHEELTQWQSELARKETALDLRQDALGKNKPSEKSAHKNSSQLEQQLAIAKDEIKQLEEENGEQLQEFESLEARFGALQKEYEVAQERITELEAALEAERARSSTDGESWKNEFRELRGELERYYEQLTHQLDKVAGNVHSAAHEAYTPLSAGAAHAKSAELRRRAQSRRENKGQNDTQGDDLS